MLRQMLLLFSVAVLFTSFLVVHQVDGQEQDPWSQTPNCTTYRCNPAEEEGFTLEECTKKHGADRAKFHPNGSYCNCSVCMKILRKGEDCTPLTIMDSAAYVLCDTNLTCSFSSRTCE
ncbi:hypothetical protein TYRP_013093 [Tyrophagus putrescentiae]|nr:hypothetical protein TYRP_013093 [Tyrophagus putrescentiae]